MNLVYADVENVLGGTDLTLGDRNADVDEWIWIVVGDLPPAYITCEESPNPASALDAYIGAMGEWVNAAKKRISTNGLIPVNVTPTLENAEALQKRLAFLDERILSQYRSDLVNRS